jgi:hypothetical protein
MVMGFPWRHYFFSPPHAARVLCMRAQKTSDDMGVVIRQIEALDELINMAYKEILNGSVLGHNLASFLA